MPILNWLPKYNWRTDLFKDFIAGFTVAIMHIPQGQFYTFGFTLLVMIYS